MTEDELPWYTYPCIDFLRDLIDPDWRIFEYGSGSSTVFYSKMCKELKSVEHDKKWFKEYVADNVETSLIDRDAESIRESLQDEVEFFAKGFSLPNRGSEQWDHYDGLYIDPWKGYASQIYKYPREHFDFVAVDGMARNLCLFYASKMVDRAGYILLDNSDRWQYNALQRYLIEQGFGRVDFWGNGPRITNRWCTSVFSKNFKNASQNIERPLDSGDIFTAGR